MDSQLPQAQAQIKARVASVTPRPGGLFSVTLSVGSSNQMYWFVTDDPPRLGDLLSVADADLKNLTLESNGRLTKVSIIEGGDLKVVPDRFRRRLVAIPWLKRVQEVMSRPLYDYQVEGAGWIGSQITSSKTGVILGDEPGVGKSATSIAAIVASGLFPAIIVCPASLKHNWQREFEYCKLKLKTCILEKGTGPIPASHVIIVNYDLLKRRETQLNRIGAKCIVFDEGHLLKEPYPLVNHRAAVATRIAHKIGRAIILTGTPLLNKPEELWRLLHIINPRKWPSFAHYKFRYCTRPGPDEENVKQFTTKRGRIKRPDELRALTDPILLRRLRSQVLPFLPPKSRRSILVSLEPVDALNYKAADKDVVQWLTRIGSLQRASDATKAIAIAKLTMLRKIAAISKLRRAFPEYIQTWFDRTERQPLVVFGYHRDVLAGAEQICRKLGLKVSVIHGNDSHEKRNQAVESFQNGETDVFLGPIQSAGLGLNLQRASDTLFLERLWTPSPMIQAEARVERIGQKDPTTATYLDAAGTVDEHIANVLNAKQRLIDKVVDDKNFVDDTKAIGTMEEVVALMASRRNY